MNSERIDRYCRKKLIITFSCIIYRSVYQLIMTRVLVGVKRVIDYAVKVAIINIIKNVKIVKIIIALIDQ